MDTVVRLWSASRAEVVLSTATAGGATALSLGIGWLLARLADGTGPTATLVAGVGLAVAIRAVSTAVRRDLRAEIARRVSQDLGGRYLRHAFALPMDAHLDPTIGGIELVARFEGHREIREAVADAILGVFTDAVTAGLAVAALGLLDPHLAVVTALGLPVLPLAAHVARRALERPQADAYDAGCRTMRAFVDGVMDPRAIKAAGASAWARDRVVRPFAEELAGERAVGRIRAVASAGSEALSTLVLLAVVAVGAQAARGDVLFAWAIVGVLLGPIESLSQLGPALERARVALARIDAVWSFPIEPAAGLPVDPAGDLVLHGVTFGYRPGCPVLRDVSLVVPAGTTLAVVGASGSGKSTLIALLLGLYRPWSGQIRVGGVPLDRADLEGWRRSVGTVLQHTVLVADAVAENVGFGRAVVEADLREALATADAAGFVAGLPAGLDTVLHGGDRSLSGGQAQRLGIARAVAGRPHWLLLDEATAHLDGATEARVLDALRVARPGGATVVVAHRLSAVRDADCIVVLDQGRIVARGTHAELLAQEGPYADLLARQLADREAA